MDIYDEIEALEAAFSNSLPEGFLCTVERDERIGFVCVQVRLMRDDQIEGFTHYISPITLQYLSIDQIVFGSLSLDHPIREWIRKVAGE